MSINDAVRSAAKNAISECPVGFEARCKILEVVLQHRGSHKHGASDAARALLHVAEFKASLPDGVGHTELQVGGTTLHKRYKRRQPAGDVVDVDAPQADNIADEPQEPQDLGAPSADLGATSGDEGAIMKACPTCNTMVAACGWANHVENCQPVPADPLPPPPVNDKWPCRRCGVIRTTEHARLQHEKFCEGPFPVVTPNPLKTVEGLDLTWSSDPFQTDTDKAVKLQEEYIKQFRKHPSLGYTGTPAKAKLPAAKVAAQSFATPIFGKGKKDKMRYGLKKRVRGGSTPQGEEYDDDMGELICKKHKKEQKRVPTNFIFDQMLTYRDTEDNRLRMAISIFQKRTKETRFNITIRCLRLREEKEDGYAVLEWDGGNILVPYCSVEKEIIPHSMDGRGYYVVDVETYQEVTADDEGSVYGDEEEEGTVVEA